MSELKPCPFCGNAAATNACGDGFFVICPNEECFVQPETGAFEKPDDAVAKWNTRAEARMTTPLSIQDCEK